MRIIHIFSLVSAGLIMYSIGIAEPESGFFSGDINHGDEMEVDHAPPQASRLSAPAQCSDHDTSADTRGLKLAGSALCTLNMRRRMESLSLYDGSLGKTHKQPLSLSDSFKERFNTLQSYKVTEPIGCAMLLSSNQTSDPKTPRLPAVCTDMGTMSTLLANKGWDILCKDYYVDKNRFLSRLDSLANLPLDKYSVFLFYYTGHGLAEGVILNDSGEIPYADIVTKVSAIHCLRNKPKIFIFDSCRYEGGSASQPGNHSPACSVTSKTQFHKEIQQQHQEEVKNRDPYPPRHTLLCFSAAMGTFSLMDRAEGSFYTLAFSHAFRQLGHYLSFPEIITQVNGGTKAILYSMDQEQHPVFISTLEKQLVLSSKWTRKVAGWSNVMCELCWGGGGVGC